MLMMSMLNNSRSAAFEELTIRFSLRCHQVIFTLGTPNFSGNAHAWQGKFQWTCLTVPPHSGVINTHPKSDAFSERK
jgi:hypothetical protein